MWRLYLPSRRTVIGSLLVIMVLAGVVYLTALRRHTLSSFHDCTAQGYPIVQRGEREMCSDGVTNFYRTKTDAEGVSVNGLAGQVASGPPRAIQLYFSSTLEDPESLDCATTYRFPRTIQASFTPGGAALELLLDGPTGAESGRGAFTSIPDNVRLLDLTIVDGVATANFSDELRAVASGSCRVAAIRSQITNTLLQFPSIKQVDILIAGDRNVLEP